MGVNVFANGMEISCKKSDNKSIAAMPDICLSPPSPPAGRHQERVELQDQ
jgi:hypothetical protein